MMASRIRDEISPPLGGIKHAVLRNCCQRKSPLLRPTDDLDLRDGRDQEFALHLKGEKGLILLRLIATFRSASF